MKHKGIMIGGIVVIVLIILAAVFAGTYNSMISKQTDVQEAFSNMDTQLQRRADLIPNLLETVKGYMAHEQEIMTAVADARSKLAGAATVEDKQAADSELSSALSRLLMVAENYPDLKADSQFTALTDELAGTENRIAVARRDYNETVTAYNKSIRTFPSNLFAAMFGFEEEPLFEADEGAEQAPKVSF